jgi:hypothetical protein
MGTVFVPATMKHLAAAAAVAALGLPVAQASSPATMPGFVYTPGYGNSIVARYDPLSLARSGLHGVRLRRPAALPARARGLDVDEEAGRPRLLGASSAARRLSRYFATPS